MKGLKLMTAMSYEHGDPQLVKSRSGIFHGGPGIRNRVRTRQKTINKRLKQFNVLSSVFCHGALKHGVVLETVAVLTQLSFRRGEGLFQIDNNDYYHEVY